MNNACEESKSIQTVFHVFAQCVADKCRKAERLFFNVLEVVECNVVFCFLNPFILEVEEDVLHEL